MSKLQPLNNKYWESADPMDAQTRQAAMILLPIVIAFAAALLSITGYVTLKQSDNGNRHAIAQHANLLYKLHYPVYVDTDDVTLSYLYTRDGKKTTDEVSLPKFYQITGGATETLPFFGCNIPLSFIDGTLYIERVDWWPTLIPNPEYADVLLKYESSGYPTSGCMEEQGTG